MDKEMLVEILKQGNTSVYSWALYFFKIDRRKQNPYTAYKIRFKNDTYLQLYIDKLIEMVIENQLGKVSEIKKYTGENAKISCDMIEIDNELVKEQWDYLVRDIAEASDEKVTGKYHGYILEGTPLVEDKKNTIFFKIANPVINLTNKRGVVFTFNSNSELAEMSDEICKLYMNVDCIVTNGRIYSFNYKMEDLFNMEKTMQKLKTKALEEIIATDAFEDIQEFEQMANSYKSPRTFITLKAERVERIKDKMERKKIAKMLNIDTDKDNKFVFRNEDDVSLLIRYLCFKVFKDYETEELLEANNVTELSINK